MKTNKFEKKIKDIEATLTSFKYDSFVDETEKTPDSFEPAFEIDYDIQLVEKDRAEIDVNIDVKFKPYSPFSIVSSYKVECEFNGDIQIEEIEKNIERLTMQAGNKNSLMVAFITGQVFNNPFIMPPFLEFKKQKNKK